MGKEERFSTKSERLQFCCTVAGEGIVLLRNEDHILPLADRKLAVFGATQLGAQIANEGIKVDFENSVGISEALMKRNIPIDEELYDSYCAWRRQFVRRTYGEWRNMHVVPEMEISFGQVKASKERGADTAVIVLTRASYENSDMNIEVGDYILSGTEMNMIRNVCSVYEDVILLLHIGCSIDLGFLEECKIKGILYLNHLGVNGNLAMADIMTGAINPSGKLPVSLAKHFMDYPSSANFGQQGGGLLQDYKEDIYVGYRYFETFAGADRNLVFPFGYGLSYTTFAVTDEKFTEEDGVITVSARVENTGDTAGKQVLQLYYASPDISDGAVLSGPQKQLCGFEKTRLLAPGESELVTFSLKADSMASFDDVGVLGAPSAWVMEKGIYKIMLGTDSHAAYIVGTHAEPATRVLECCHAIVTTLPERLIRSGEYEKLPQPVMQGDKYYGISAIGETILPVSCSYNMDRKDFSDCKAGERYSYKLLPGTGGGYRLSFAGDRLPEGTADTWFDIYVNGIKLHDLKPQAASVELTLPLERCELTVSPLRDNICVDKFIFCKIDIRAVIEAEGMNIVEAANVYECDFGVTSENYEDDGYGNSGSFITSFWTSGKFAVYKLEVKESGTYAIRFKYAYDGEERPINTIITVLASNIVQPLGGNILKKTFEKGEKRIFEQSDAFQILLPQGEVYLKVASESVPFPDISQIYLEKCDGEVTESDIDLDTLREKNAVNPGVLRHGSLDDPDDYPRYGIQFADVYHNPALMKPFLEQLTNRELATVVSGTSKNRTPGGDVGCNSPLYERGLPAAQTADGPCGLRQNGQLPIAFPVGMVLTATFNKELYEQYGLCMAHECLQYEVDYLLGPSINILRNPAGGRNCSYFTEDPYLDGITASYYVKGLQSKGIAAIVKHYTANSTEFERLKSNSRVSGRALREIYLKPFEIVCKNEKPWGMMSSYNHVNDVKVCEDYTLITEIAHEEWQWDGIFMTDWWNDSKHVKELLAGHDLRMATGDIDGVTQALDSGELTREQVYVCAERIIRTLMKLGRIRNERSKDSIDRKI